MFKCSSVRFLLTGIRECDIHKHKQLQLRAFYALLHFEFDGATLPNWLLAHWLFSRDTHTEALNLWKPLQKNLCSILFLISGLDFRDPVQIRLYIYVCILGKAEQASESFQINRVKHFSILLKNNQASYVLLYYLQQ